MNKIRMLDKTALPKGEHLTGDEHSRNQHLNPISMHYGKINSRQKSYFIPLPYITVFCPPPLFPECGSAIHIPGFP
ncbi:MULTISPECIES: hypothetical protein [unclassified Akkermansia]|uniref:hypothetical protein n=2 Tax=Akkermansia TaxID=239934 RepID=UPI000E7EA610|nr:MULTISPECIES: hypothetical protein [unclassified Akkermansia]HBN18287.1 hypothetical protein [Akkermansia sp.]